MKFLSQLKTQGIKNSIILASGNITSSVIAAITFIITSRVLSPSQFGTFSALLAILLLFTRLSDFGINIALQRQIARESSPDTISQLIKTGLILKLISWLILLIFGIILAPLLNTYVLKNIPSNTLIIIFILVIITLIYDLLLVIIQAIQKFSLNNFYIILLSFLKLFGVITLVLLAKTSGHSVFYLFSLAPLVLIFIILKNIPLSGNYKLAIFKSQTRSLLQISKWTGLAIIAAAAADNLDIVLIQTFLNDHQTGLYAAASRLAIFFSLIGMSVGTVLSIQVAKYRSPNQISKYINKAKFFAIVSILSLFLISLFSYWGIYLTAGKSYLSAVPALSLLLIATGIDIAASPFIALFYLFNRPRYYFYAGIILLFTLVSSNLILIPYYGIIGAATAKLITRLVVFIFTLYYTRKATHHHYKSLDI